MTSHDNQVDCRLNVSSLVCRRHLHLTHPPSVSYMRQWTGVSIGSDNGLSPIQRQAFI